MLLPGWTRPPQAGAFLRVASWRALSWSWTAAATPRLDDASAFVARWRAQSWSWTAAAFILLDEVDCCCYYPAARGQRLPSRRQVACAKLELDCCCYYPAGRGLFLALRRQVACAELELVKKMFPHVRRKFWILS